MNDRISTEPVRDAHGRLVDQYGNVIIEEPVTPGDDTVTATSLGGVGGAVTGAIAGSTLGPAGAVAGAVVGGLVGAVASGAIVNEVDKHDDDTTVTGISSADHHKTVDAIESADWTAAGCAGGSQEAHGSSEPTDPSQTGVRTNQPDYQANK